MKFKKIISIAMSAIITAVSASTFSGTSVNRSIFNASAEVDTEAIYDSWQEAYRDVLDDFMQGNIYKNMANDNLYYSFFVKDLNSDDIPELFLCSPQSIMPSYLYTFYNNRIKPLGGFIKGGDISYCSNENIVIASGGTAGYVYYQAFRIQNGEIVMIDDLFYDTNYQTRNGVEITRQEYTATVQKYQAIEDVDYTKDRIVLTYNNVISCVELAKSYNSWQEAYKEKLIDIMNSSMFFSKAQNGEDMCSTYAIRDLNNDGIPELFVNYAPATFAHSELYTFYDSKIIKLMTLPRAGFVSYSTEKGLIYSCGGGGAGGYVYHTYSKILNGRIVDVDSFMISAGTTPITYMINEDQVSELEFNTAKKQYDSINWTTVGREKFFEDINSDISFTITTTTTTTKRTTTSTTTATTTTTKMTTATTTTTRKVTSTTPSSTTTSRIMLGDVNVDKNVNAVDASYILSEYVISSTGGKSEYKIDKIAADVDGNGRIDSCDASCVLLYYRYISTCASEPLDLQEYIQSCKTDSPNVDVTLSLSQKKLTYDEAKYYPRIEIILSAKSSNGATINSTGIHIIYDDRLQIVPDEYDNVADCIIPRCSFETEKYEANGIFVATSSDRERMLSADGTNLWKFTLHLPGNVKVGDIYPINIVYMDGDLFDNCLSNDTEKLRENAFSHIEQGYIEIIDSPQTTTSKATTTTAKPTTTTSTAQKTTTITTTTVNGEFKLEVTSITIKNGDQYTIPINREDVVFKSTNPDIAVVSPKGVVTAIGTGEAIINVIDKDYNVIQLKVSVKSGGSSQNKYPLGDVNNDGKVNAVDASTVLTYYANISTNKDGGFTEDQKKAADLDNNGDINAVDASYILSYYAYTSTTKEAIMPVEEYMKKK